MQMIKCDRCETIYEPDGGKCNAKLASNSMYLTMGSQTEYDLCHSCFNIAVKWIRDGPKPLDEYRKVSTEYGMVYE